MASGVIATTILILALTLAYLMGASRSRTPDHSPRTSEDVSAARADNEKPAALPHPQKEPEKPAQLPTQPQAETAKPADQPSAVHVDSVFGGNRAGEEWDDNGPKMKFCWCPPGKFMMGSPKNDLLLGGDKSRYRFDN